MDPRELLRKHPLVTRAWWWLENRRTHVHLLSYPKCGRTWLRLMIGKALVDDVGLTDADPLEITTMHKLSRQVPRIRVSHDDYPQMKRPHEVERDKRKYAGKDVIFLVRDPRDTMISYYFQASKRRGRFSGTPSEFLRHDVGSLDTIITFYNVWAEARHQLRTLCLVRYEDLHANPARELTRVMNVLGRTPTPKVIADAVEFAKFDNMRALEQKGALGAADRLRPADANDLESYKTRKGQVGGYREYLSADDIAYMNARIAERLSPFYPEYRRAPER